MRALLALAQNPASAMPDIAEALSIATTTAERLPGELGARIGLDGGRGLKKRVIEWATKHRTELELALHSLDEARVQKGLQPSARVSASSATTTGSEFAGRVTELAQLKDFIDDVVNGRSRIATVVGEAGAGKSRLVSETLNIAQSNGSALAVTGQCVSLMGGGEALLPLREIVLQLAPFAASLPAHARPRNFLAALHILLPHHFPDGNPRVPTTTDSQSIFYVLRDGLVELAAVSPLVIAVEDVHWADVETIEFLHYLTSSRITDPFGLLVTVRSADPSGSVIPSNVRSLISELEGDPRTTSVRVGEEAADAVSYVSDYLRTNYFPNELPTAFIEGLAEVAGDNALFVQELLLDLRYRGALVHDSGIWKLSDEIDWTSVPPRIESTLSTRIDALDPREYRLATLGAVQGPRFYSQVLAEALDEDVDSLTDELLDRLVRHERFVEEEAIVRRWANAELYQFRFVHHLYATLLAERMGPIEHVKVHASVLRALDSLFPTRDPDLEPTRLHHAIHAGDGERALEIGQHVVDAYLSTGAANSALAVCDRLAPLVTPDREALLSVLRAQTLEALGRCEEALTLTEAVAESKIDLPQPAQLRFLHTHSLVLRRCGHRKTSKAVAIELLSLSRDIDDEDWMSTAARDLGRAAESTGDYEESQSWYGEALRYAQGDSHQQAAALDKLGYAAYRSGDFETAQTRYTEGLELKDVGDSVRSALLLNLGILRMTQGRFTLARDLIRESLDVPGCPGLPVHHARALSNYGLANAFLLESDESVRASLKAIDILGALQDRLHLAISFDRHGSLLLLLGRVDEADANFRQALEIALELGDSSRCRLASVNLAAVAFARRRLDEFTEWNRAYPPIKNDPQERAFGHLFAAKRASLEGRGSAAAKSFRTAATQLRRLGEERLALRCDENAGATHADLLAIPKLYR